MQSLFENNQPVGNSEETSSVSSSLDKQLVEIRKVQRKRFASQPMSIQISPTDMLEQSKSSVSLSTTAQEVFQLKAKLKIAKHKANTFKAAELKTTLPRIEELYTNLKSFYKYFSDIYAKPNAGLVLEIEKLKIQIADLKNTLIALQIPKAKYKKDRLRELEECIQHLENLIQNQSYGVHYCLKDYIIPLYNTYWNFRNSFHIHIDVLEGRRKKEKISKEFALSSDFNWNTFKQPLEIIYSFLLTTAKNFTSLFLTISNFSRVSKLFKIVAETTLVLDDIQTNSAPPAPAQHRETISQNAFKILHEQSLTKSTNAETAKLQLKKAVDTQLKRQFTLFPKHPSHAFKILLPFGSFLQGTFLRQQIYKNHYPNGGLYVRLCILSEATPNSPMWSYLLEQDASSADYLEEGRIYPKDCRRIKGKHASKERYSSKKEIKEYVIHQMAAQGNVEAISVLLKKDGTLLEKPDQHKRLALHRAVKFKQLAAAQLLTTGQTINAANKYGETPIYYAIANDDFNLINYLIQHGANLNYKDHGGRTPLHAAFESCSTATVELLLAKGANPHLLDNKGLDCIHYAASNQNHAQAILEKFFTMGEQKTVDNIGNTLLHTAVIARNAKLIKFLVNQDPSCLHAVNLNNETPIQHFWNHHFQDDKDVDIIKLLYELGANIEDGFNNGMHPIELTGAPPYIHYGPLNKAEIRRRAFIRGKCSLTTSAILTSYFKSNSPALDRDLEDASKELANFLLNQGGKYQTLDNSDVVNYFKTDPNKGYVVLADGDYSSSLRRRKYQHLNSEYLNKHIPKLLQHIKTRWNMDEMGIALTQRKIKILEDFSNYLKTHLAKDPKDILNNWGSNYQTTHGENPFLTLQYARRPSGYLRFFYPENTDSLKLFIKYLTAAGYPQAKFHQFTEFQLLENAINTPKKDHRVIESQPAPATSPLLFANNS